MNTTRTRNVPNIDTTNPFHPHNLANLSDTRLAQLNTYNTTHIADLERDAAKWANTDTHEHDRALGRVREAKSRHAAIVNEQRRRDRIAQQHRGDVGVNPDTGTTHFLNSWDEPYCGATIDNLTTLNGDYRATCGRCQRAGDATKRDGTWSAGGSPARRH